VTQVVGLVVVSLTAAIAAHSAILMLIPPPPPEVYRLSEVAAALRTPDKDFTARNGHDIEAHLADRPQIQPDPRHPLNHREQWLVHDLAAQLAVKETAIAIAFPGDNMRGPRMARIVGMHGPPPPHPDHGNMPPPPSTDLAGPPGPPPGDDHRPGMHNEPGGRVMPADPWLIAPFNLDVQRADGRWVTLKVEDSGLFSNWRWRIVAGFGLSMLALTPVAYLFARWLAAPITGFARAAERLGRNPDAPPLELKGPAEVAMAAAAFNQMQDRIRRYVQDRTAMIGAVAHDLRTPLTRLRFRIEQAPDDLRAKMAQDLDEMEAMIAGALAFVRDASQPAVRKRLELRSLVETVAQEMAETGLDVTLKPGPPLIIEGDVIGLRRAIANLVENAAKYGHRARISVTEADGQAVIQVDDDGPGIAMEHLDRVFEPFVRMEPSRNRTTGGAGLGLAVVRTVARGHGGDAVLENRPEGGLTAKLLMPLQPKAGT
jgi:signal transduction histidine kinase